MSMRSNGSRWSPASPPAEHARRRYRARRTPGPAMQPRTSAATSRAPVSLPSRCLVVISPAEGALTSTVLVWLAMRRRALGDRRRSPSSYQRNACVSSSNRTPAYSPVSSGGSGSKNARETLARPRMAPNRRPERTGRNRVFEPSRARRPARRRRDIQLHRNNALDSDRPFAAVSRATRVCPRAMMTSSSRSARSTSRDRCVLAACIECNFFTSHISYPTYSSKQ